MLEGDADGRGGQVRFRRQADPAHRGFGQTPFDIGQCRRDCPEFRAVEDRLQDVGSYLLAQRPNELYAARHLANRAELVDVLEGTFGDGAVERGRRTFAAQCASCHSSQEPPYENVDFWAVSEDDPTLRIDWLGDDEVVPVAEVGTYSARAFHSNHMEGHVWEEYGSETLRQKEAEQDAARLAQQAHGHQAAAEETLDQSIELLQQLVDANPESAEAWAIFTSGYGLKIGYSPFKGPFLGPRASRALDEAMRLEPDNPEVLNRYGVVLGHLDEHEAALTKFERALERDPENPKLLNNYAVSLSSVKRYDEAVKRFEQALRYDPQNCHT